MNNLAASVVVVALTAGVGHGQDVAKMLQQAKHGLAAAAEAGLAAAKRGAVVHVELEQDGSRLVFSVDVADGARSKNVVLDSGTLAVLDTADEEDDHRRAVAAARIPLVRAIAVAERASAADGVLPRAYEAQLLLRQDAPVFEVRVFASGARTVVVDAVTGEVRGAVARAAPPPDEVRFSDTFILQPGELASRGKNTFFVLEPGHTLVLEGTEAGEPVQLTITVLDATKVIDGVETRVVEERETKGGQLAEVSRNFCAISTRTACVFYFGEEVDIYANGVVTSHDGAWLAGKDGARFGLLMPGVPLLGSRYYQEIAPTVAMDRAEIVALDEVVQCGAGTFRDCLRTIETTPLEPGDRATKVYAPGIGLVSDGPLRLVKHGSVR